MVNNKMIPLSKAMEKYHPNYNEILKEKNLLVVSPTGSGKTYWLFNHLFTDKTKKYLYLCDTTNLKRMVMHESVVKNSKNKVLDKNKDKEVFTFGKNQNVIAMTYSEFDYIIRYKGTNNVYEVTDEQLEYISQYDMIIADEAQNLINFSQITKGDTYFYALDRLQAKYINTKIIWLTATPQYIYRYQNKNNERYQQRLNEYYELHKLGANDKQVPFPIKTADILRNFEIIEFTDEHNIQRYLNKRLDYIRDYKDIPNELRKYKDYFERMNGKVLIYITEIEYMKIINEWVNEIEWMNSITIWSTNNSEKKMNAEQERVRKHIVDNEKFPDEYNCIIINDAMLTGINIRDKSVEIMIANSSDETRIIQARGRLRQDIDLLVVRAKNLTELNQIKLLENIDIDKALAEYTSKEATKTELEQLILKYNLRDNVKTERQLTVNKLLKQLKELGYTIETKRKTIDGNKRTLYVINKK